MLGSTMGSSHGLYPDCTTERADRSGRWCDYRSGRVQQMANIACPPSAAGVLYGLANGTAGLFPPPALGERRHRSLSRRPARQARVPVAVLA
jgi:hypothetical protein